MDLLCKLMKHGDKINQLPDDILISIISRLTLREATATSIVSRRWRYLHTYVSHLSFPQFNFENIWPRDLIKERHPNHVNTIDHVLDSHRGGRVQELKVNMIHMKGANFEKWVEFALTREVESIDIRILHIGFGWEGYFLQLSNLMWTKSRCLRELYLSRVNVTDQDFELLVSNFPAIESLSIDLPSKCLKNISIVGHPKLKQCDISRARALESIEIRDVMNLISLRVYELPRECAVQLTNLHELVKFITSDVCIHSYVELFAKVPSCVRDQLQLLHLTTTLPSIPVSSIGRD